MQHRKTRRWPIVVGLISLVVVGILVLAQDQEVLRVRSSMSASDPRFADYVASLVGTDVTRGDDYQVLRNGVEIFPAMLEAIERARHRISFECFIYDEGKVAGRFTKALVAAAKRGVTVRIVLDAFGSSSLPDEYVDELTQAGVRIVWFNVLRPWTIEETNYRTHRKVLVVDGSVAFTGGVGLADHWDGNAENEDHWRDTQFQATGPAVRALEASFYENWLESGGEEAPALDPEDPPEATPARSIVIWSNPTGGASNVKVLYLLTIAGARRSIDIQSPYFVLDASSRWSLDQARQRGVRVRILTEGEVTDAKPVKFASRHAYQGLLDAGYELYEYQPTMMHVKVMVIDGVWSVFGSANFDNRSFELNDELTLAVGDRNLAARLTSDFEKDLGRAQRLVAGEWRGRSPFVKVRETFWSFFGELF